MRISFFLFFLFSFPVFLLAQKKKYMAFDAEWRVASSPESTVYSCNCYVNEKDQFVGKFRCYHVHSDVLVKEYSFDNDVLNGPVNEYFDNGELKLDAEYKDGLPINEWKEYDEDGALVLFRQFNEHSQVVRDYFQEQSPYQSAMAFSHKKEEPPIYTTNCIRLKIDEQKYACSEEEIAKYLANPPLPGILRNDPLYAGKRWECTLLYTISEKGIVSDAEIVQSTGDDFLDMLAQAHVLNMVPFESAKQYGVPINYTQEAKIVFQF